VCEEEEESDTRHFSPYSSEFGAHRNQIVAVSSLPFTPFDFLTAGRISVSWRERGGEGRREAERGGERRREAERGGEGRRERATA
jgi:hypothetical protein